MSLKLKSLFIVVLVLLVSSASAAEHKYLKAFKPAKEGMVRYVITLPHKDRKEEKDFRVELIVGKTMLTDGVNHIRLGGKIESKPLNGWGFTFYNVEKFGPAASTLIGVPAGTPKVTKFVSIPSTTIRYNSRIPIVVYLPKDGELRYRIWQASKRMDKAKKG